MNITESIKKEIMLLNDKFMMEAEDGYNFWEEHIKYVLKEALDLAEKCNADVEIVELAALLHDIALVAKIGTRAEHHVIGAEMAETILAKYNYPQSKISKVKECVLNHRNSKNGTTIEEICVSDADILAHFDNIPMIISCVLKKENMTVQEVRSKLKDSFESDYNDLSERTKHDFTDRYALICQMVING